MPVELPPTAAAAATGLRRWLRGTYLREVERGDARQLETEDPAERAEMNAFSPEIRRVRRMLERLDAGEVVTICRARVEDFPGACDVMPWLSDRSDRRGITIGPDDSARPARPGEQVSP